MFDKTGTLTTGVLSVTSSRLFDVAYYPNPCCAPASCLLFPLSSSFCFFFFPEPHLSLFVDRSERDFWYWVGSAESSSEHSIGRAIVRHANTVLATAPVTSTSTTATSLVLPDDFKTEPGRGLSCRVDGHSVVIGNRAWLAACDVVMPSASEGWMLGVTDPSVRAATTSIGVAVDGRGVAIIELSDVIKAESSDVVRALGERGIQVWMLSGDAQSTAEAIGQQCGIQPDRVFGGVLPQSKCERVKQLQATGLIVAMVFLSSPLLHRPNAVRHRLPVSRRRG